MWNGYPERTKTIVEWYEKKKQFAKALIATEKRQKDAAEKAQSAAAAQPAPEA